MVNQQTKVIKVIFRAIFVIKNIYYYFVLPVHQMCYRDLGMNYNKAYRNALV